MSWRVLRSQLRGDANERATFHPLPQDSCAATLVSPMTFHHTPPTTAQMRKEATPQMAPRRIVDIALYSSVYCHVSRMSEKIPWYVKCREVSRLECVLATG